MPPPLPHVISSSATLPDVCRHLQCARTPRFEPAPAPEAPSPAVLAALSDSCTVLPRR